MPMNPDRETELYSVELSLYEFFRATWPNATRIKANPAALEMLLAAEDEDDIDPSMTPRLQTLVRKHERDIRNAPPRMFALTHAQQASIRASIQASIHDYGQTFTRTYPKIWYACRLIHAVGSAGAQRVAFSYTFVYAYCDFYVGRHVKVFLSQRALGHQIYCLYLHAYARLQDVQLSAIQFYFNLPKYLWGLASPFVSPVYDFVDLLIGPEYDFITQHLADDLYRIRAELGRSRGFNFITAFYARCILIGDVLRAHQLGVAAQFLSRNLTIRRGAQLAFPISIACGLWVQQMLVPTMTNTRGLNKVERTHWGIPHNHAETLIVYDELETISSTDPRYTRLASGMSYIHMDYTMREFDAGEYKQVPHEYYFEIVHPGEFTHIAPKPQKLGTRQTISFPPDQLFGHYLFTPAERDQIPDLPTIKEYEADRDIEDEASLKAAVMKIFVPRTEYITVRDHDQEQLATYTRVKQAQSYRKRLAKQDAFIDDPQHSDFVHPETGFEPQEAVPKKKRSARAKRGSDPFAAEKSSGIDITPKTTKGVQDTFAHRMAMSLLKQADRDSFLSQNEFFERINDHLYIGEEEKEKVVSDDKKAVSDDKKAVSDNEATVSAKKVTIDKMTVAGDGVYIYTQVEDDAPNNNGLRGVRSRNIGPRDAPEVSAEFKALQEMYTSIFAENGLVGYMKEVNDMYTRNDRLVRRMAFSPFGLTYHEKPHHQKINSFLNQEIRTVPYAFDTLTRFATVSGVSSLEESLAASIEHDLTLLGQETMLDAFSESHLPGEPTTFTATNKPSGILKADIPSLSTAHINEKWSADDTTHAVSLAHNAPSVFPRAMLFITPLWHGPWRCGGGTIEQVQWLMTPVFFYAFIEFVVRSDMKGIKNFFSGKLGVRLSPSVHHTIEHFYRLPCSLSKYAFVGPEMTNIEVAELCDGFRTKRGALLYGQPNWSRLWTTSIRPALTANQLIWIRQANAMVATITRSNRGAKSTHLSHENEASRMVVLYGSEKKELVPRLGRVLRSDRLLNATKTSDGTALSTAKLAHRQRLFNTIGGTSTLKKGLAAITGIRREMKQFALYSFIRPGRRMHELPKGLILVGAPGNGRTHFVRALTTQSRLPLLLTESNRYVDEIDSLIRLKKLFGRARKYAPNILCIRDVDFMGRARNMYPMFAAVRTTTYFMKCIDGFTHGGDGVEKEPSEQDIFIVGTATSLIPMDAALLRSGRLDWAINFRYPDIKKRRSLLIAQSQTSLVNGFATDVDWAYFAAQTENFTCLDIRILLNGSAMHLFTHRKTMHTTASLSIGLGTLNQLHDDVVFSSKKGRTFFQKLEDDARYSKEVRDTNFFTQTGAIPMYHKLMYMFKVLLPGETDTITQRWRMPHVWLPDDLTCISDGLLAFFSEGLVVYNMQVASPYPVITFDNYCYPIFEDLRATRAQVDSYHTLERHTQAHLFISTFDNWQRAHPDKWTPTKAALHEVKHIRLREEATTMWRQARLKKRYSPIHGLNEVESEIIFGLPAIRTKIRNRIAFMSDKLCEPYSRDAALFGTFETHSHLAFKCKKASTGRRVKQVGVEMLSLFKKEWRSSEPKGRNVLQPEIPTVKGPEIPAPLQPDVAIQGVSLAPVQLRKPYRVQDEEYYFLLEPGLDAFIADFPWNVLCYWLGNR